MVHPAQQPHPCGWGLPFVPARLGQRLRSHRAIDPLPCHCHVSHLHSCRSRWRSLLLRGRCCPAHALTQHPRLQLGCRRLRLGIAQPALLAQGLVRGSHHCHLKSLALAEAQAAQVPTPAQPLAVHLLARRQLGAWSRTLAGRGAAEAGRLLHCCRPMQARRTLTCLGLWPCLSAGTVRSRLEGAGEATAQQHRRSGARQRQSAAEQ